MTQGQVRFSILIVAGFCGLFYKLGIFGFGSLILGILIAILGPMAVSLYHYRARSKRAEQAMAVLALTLEKQAAMQSPKSAKDTPSA